MCQKCFANWVPTESIDEQQESEMLSGDNFFVFCFCAILFADMFHMWASNEKLTTSREPNLVSYE